MAAAAKHCILIVDDDPDLRRVFKIIFGKDYRVIEALNGAEALSLLRTEAPRLMVLDLEMPGMDGLEVLKAVKAARPSLPVIMLTGKHDVEAARSALFLGACQFITKPFGVESLRSEIQRLLDATGEGAAKKDSSGRPWRIQS